jgi:hypothetical protein
LQNSLSPPEKGRSNPLQAIRRAAIDDYLRHGTTASCPGAEVFPKGDETKI